jgi:hypothetical protein
MTFSTHFTFYLVICIEVEQKDCCWKECQGTENPKGMVILVLVLVLEHPRAQQEMRHYALASSRPARDQDQDIPHNNNRPGTWYRCSFNDDLFHKSLKIGKSFMQTDEQLLLVACTNAKSTCQLSRTD